MALPPRSDRTRPALRRWALALLAAALLGACATLDELQRQWIFRPTTEDWRGFHSGILSYEERWIPVGSTGERLHAWWVPAAAAERRAPILLYLHGSRWNLTGSAYRIAGFQRMGFNVLAVDYRGFGKSSALLPSEQSVYEDARAAWAWVVAEEPDPRRRVIYGHSLGGAVATELAQDAEVAAVVLESTFTSIRDMALRTPAALLPLDSMLTQRFDTLAKIGRLRAPVFIVQGAEDTVVPPDMAHQLYAAAREPKRLFLVDGFGHRGAVRAVAEDLSRALAVTVAGPCPREAEQRPC